MQGTALETRGEVTATAYDATGTRMVTCTAAGAVHVWDRDDDTDTVRDDAPGPWRQSSSWAAHENGACTSIAFAPPPPAGTTVSSPAPTSGSAFHGRQHFPLGADHFLDKAVGIFVLR